MSDCNALTRHDTTAAALNFAMTPTAIKELTEAGTLRIALNLSNDLLVRKTNVLGSFAGLGVELARHLAALLHVSPEFVVYESAGAACAACERDEWDIERWPHSFGQSSEINEMVSPILTQWATLNEAFVFGGGAIMDTVSLIGVDLGKHSFHLHAQNAFGRMVWRKKSTRTQMFKLLGNIPSCVVAMEACAGAHWFARRIQALGHEARLISPQFVKPFRQGNKNDFADAQAICEAASRPSMRFVSPHNEAQQIVSALHRVRESLVRDRTGTINQIHAFLLEFGISLPRGMAVIRRLPAVLEAEPLPPRLVAVLERLRAHFKYLDEQIGQIERELLTQLHEDERSERLLEIPGIGPITASVLMSELGDAHQYGSARQFAASIGLVPRQYSTGGKSTLLSISKRGDKELRRLLVQCARAIMRRIERRTDSLGVWVCSLLARRHSNVVSCALANKLARIAWAILAKGTHYRSIEATLVA